MTAGVEYHCTLPIAPPVGQGPLEPTMDVNKHVNGGCRALDRDATSWECYLGQAAVAQQIISSDLLGQYAPDRGVG